MTVASPELRQTPLAERHAAAGARMVAFAGWSMPVSYEGIRAEHLAVRREAGVFDVSHMGQIEVSGTQAEPLLQRLLSNDVSKLAVGGAQYSVICAPDGGVLDDCIAYRLGSQRYLVVTNAARHADDLAWFERHGADADAEIRDQLLEWAMLAVQGPAAREVVARVAGEELPGRMRTGSMEVAGVAGVLVCGTGYTGEDGVELLLAPDAAPAVWDAVVREGARPVGLGARDTLRLEACLPLYGNELSPERDPIAAGLGWCCAEETGFIGADAVARARRQGPPERLAPFAMTGEGIPRAGNPVVGGGVVTSGTLSPCLGVGAGLAYLPAGTVEPGTRLEIDVRGRLRAAEVRTRPLHKPRKEPLG